MVTLQRFGGFNTYASCQYVTMYGAAPSHSSISLGCLM